jgi:negative regulator of sigma E activity
MNTQEAIREQLSALMDGELGRDEAAFLLKRIELDSELQNLWTRMHVSRDVMRQSRRRDASVDFVRRTASRIALECASEQISAAKEVTAVELTPQRNGFAAWRRIRPIAMMLAAASVAAVVVWLQPGGPVGAPILMQEASSAGPMPVGASFANAAQASVHSGAALVTSSDDRWMEDYLEQHAEFANVRKLSPHAAAWLGEIEQSPTVQVVEKVK